MNEAYTKAFATGMRAACNRVTRIQAIEIASTFTVADGDAFLAGYYAEIRRLNVAAEQPESDPKADRGDWEFHQEHDQ